MKYILTESQLEILITEDRVDFLKNQNVITPEELNLVMGDSEIEGTQKGETIEGPDGNNIVYVITNRRGKKKIKLAEDTFNSIVEADPSRNKQYAQWMIETFKGLVSEDIEEAIRFVSEDLDQATEALTIFDCVKDRKKFKTIAPSREGAPENVKDIRQYKSVGQLYIVVSAFSCDDTDEEEAGGDGKLSKKGKQLFNDLMQYKNLGQANLWKLSDRVLIYQPKTMVSSCEPLGNLANWCTRATPSGGIDPESGGSRYRGETVDDYFHRYRRYLRPGDELSEYYVIMPNELFQLPNPSSHDRYPLQFHFESNQLRHKGNVQIGEEGVRRLINEYPEVGEFFKEELGPLVAAEIQQGTGLMGGKYIKYLNMFGGKAQDVISDEVYAQGVENIRNKASEQTGPLQQNKYLQWLMENTDGVVITDYLNTNTKELDFSGMRLGELPDLSEFTNLSKLLAKNSGLNSLPPADFLPVSVEIIIMDNNNIPEVPLEGYERLTNCFVMNFNDNPITRINVGVLRRMVESNLARFVIRNLDLEQLTPENRGEYEDFMEDSDGVGYMLG